MLAYYQVLKHIRDNGQHLILDDLMKMQLFASKSNVFFECWQNAQGSFSSSFDNGPIDLPFPCMIVEFLDNNFSIEGEKLFKLFGIVERNPNDYTFFTIVETGIERFPYDVQWLNDHDKSKNNIHNYNSAKHVFREIVKKINSSYVYNHDPRIPLMVKKSVNSNKSKKTALKTSSTIYIGAKKDFKYYAESINKIIQPKRWHYRRGTWRQLSKRNDSTGKFDRLLGPDFNRIGYNRDGIKCVKGYTWINEQEIKPLNGDAPINQIRIIKGGNNG